MKKVLSIVTICTDEPMFWAIISIYFVMTGGYTLMFMYLIAAWWTHVNLLLRENV